MNILEQYNLGRNFAKKVPVTILMLVRLPPEGACTRPARHICGKFAAAISQQGADAINLIAGSTGITPRFQIVKTIIWDPEDTRKVALVCANNSPDNILLAAAFEDMRLKTRLIITAQFCPSS